MGGPSSPRRNKMSEVKKREVPEVTQLTPLVEKELTIKVGEKEYPVPVLKLGEYKKVLKYINDLEKKEDVGELENIEFAQDFFYKLLKPEHPELKKADMEDMPIFQASAEFFLKVKLALYRVPLS
jgi:hypothetical protein